MKRLLVIAILMMTAASAAVAHDTWIKTKSIDRDNATFEISSGMNFPKLGTAPAPDRVAASGWRLGDKAGRFKEFRAGTSSLEVDTRVNGQGTAVVWVAFKPREIDLTEDEVTEYFDEIGAPERMRRTWEQQGSDRKWHETYTKYAKTFVAVGGAGEDPSCIPPLGTAIELVPLVDPTTVKVGDSFVVRVLKNGYELEGQPVVAECCGTGKRTIVYANRSGHATFDIDEGGAWLFSAVDVVLQNDGTWASDHTSMCFTVGN